MILFLLLIISFKQYPYEIEPTKSKVTIKSISIECDTQGYPTISAIKDLVLQEYCKDQELDSIEISVEETLGGKNTAKMYIVHLKNNRNEQSFTFFLKMSTDGLTAQKLIAIQESEIGQKINNLYLQKENSKHPLKKRPVYNDFNQPHSAIKKQYFLNTTNKNYQQKHLPTIIWLINALSYQDQHDNTKTIEVTPAAPGKLLHDILNEENESMITECAYNFGKALATFHRACMENSTSLKTICHGDCHSKNILYDTESKKIYFIDNISMSYRPIGDEICYFLTHIFIFEYLKEKTDHWTLYITYSLSFLKGYMESYTFHEKHGLAMHIKQALEQRLNNIAKENQKEKTNSLVIEFKEAEFRKMIFQYLNRYIIPKSKI